MADIILPKVDAASEPPDPELVRKARRAALIAAAVLLVAGAWWVLHQINRGKQQDRWDRLATIEAGMRDLDGTRGWTQPMERSDLDITTNQVKSLEDFLAGVEDDGAIAAHVHKDIASLRMRQAYGVLAAGRGEPVDAYLADAQRHLEILRDKYPDSQLNWAVFGVKDARAGQQPDVAPSASRRALAQVIALRKWETDHAPKKVEPDDGVVVVLRTTAGDLRLRVFGQASPVAVAAFLERATSGALDGVRLFEARSASDENYVRVGDARTKKAAPTDDDRVTWVEATPGETRAPEAGRYRILHTKGIVTSWHGASDGDDDPQQFLIVTKDSPALNFSNTPFARVEDGPSISTLERIADLRTYVKDQPDIRSKHHELADQIVPAPTIVRALVFEKGVLSPKHDAAKVEADEKTLDGLKLDKYRKDEPPPAPPAPAAMDDGAAMGGAATVPPATPPAAGDPPPAK